MHAIVEIGGKQFRVEKGQTLKVPHLQNKVGDSIELDRVMLLGNGADVKIGRPLVEGAKVEVEVVDHGRDKKVVVFRKIRRKGFKVKRGHRQGFTRIQVKSITG